MFISGVECILGQHAFRPSANLSCDYCHDLLFLLERIAWLEDCNWAWWKVSFADRHFRDNYEIVFHDNRTT